MENKNAIKQFLMRNFSEKYGAARDYYDRFSDLYSVFFLLAILCQLWAGWAESHFFAVEMDGVVSFPSPSWALGAGLLAAILFEVTKTRIGKKLLEELYGYQNTLHAPLLAVWVVMMGISALIGYVGIGEYTAGHRAATAPTDSLTAQVDSLYLPQMVPIQKQIDGLTKKYTWKGRFKNIPTQSEHFTPQELKQDREMMESLEKRLAMLQAQHISERQKAQQSHSSALSAYHAETEEKVFSGRFFTIATELIYALCLWWNAYFAAQSAYTANIAGSIPPPNGGGNGGGGSPTSPVPTPPGHGHPYQHEPSPQPAKLNGHHRPINGQPFPFHLPDNSHQGQHPQASTGQAPPPLPQAQEPPPPQATADPPVAHPEDTIVTAGETAVTMIVSNVTPTPPPLTVTKVERLLSEWEKRECQVCGTTFEVNLRDQPKAKPRKYCSDECSDAARMQKTYFKRGKPLPVQWQALFDKKKGGGGWVEVSNDLDGETRSVEWKKKKA